MSAGVGSTPDTQWPRWEVLKQDAPPKPHQAVGSVHAVDAQHALLMARTVFARRPSAVSMWVVPATSVHAWTAQQLDAPTDEPEAAAQPRQYYVVRKSSHRRSMTFGDLVGQVEAVSLLQARAAALRQFADQPILALWLLEADAVHRSKPADAEPWFGPAVDKTYKQQSVYSSRATARRAADQGAEQ